MGNIKYQQLLLETAFCCMTSDGDIDPKEVEEIQTLCSNINLFKDYPIEQELNNMIEKLNKEGTSFMKNYLNNLSSAELTKEQEISILNFAIKVIYADGIVQYSEVKFFKTIRHRLKITNEEIREAFPDLDDNFIAEDIKIKSIEDITNQYIEIAQIPEFDLINFTINKE